jgi:hypothetical protein
MWTSRLSCSASFFEPGQLCALFIDPCVEHMRLLGAGSILRSLLFSRPARKQTGKTGQRDLAPAIELIGMDAILSSELAHGLLLLPQPR